MNFHPVNQIDERFINKEPIVPMVRGASSFSKNEIDVVGTPSISNLNWNFPITSGVCTDLDWYATCVPCRESMFWFQLLRRCRAAPSFSMISCNNYKYMF